MGYHEEEVEREGQTKTTFGFPILDLIQYVNMNNIPLSSLPVFYGKSIEDPNTYLFEFDVLCRSYNYLHDSHKLKLFHVTLKDAALRWFIGSREFSIRTWDKIKNAFLEKCQDHCRSKDAHNENFKMQQHEEESLEDFLERFKTKYNTL